MSLDTPAPPADRLRPLRARWELVLLSVRRQARLGQMVGIALGVLVLALLYVALIHYRFGWSLAQRRVPLGPRAVPTYQNALTVMAALRHGPVEQAAVAASSAVLATSDFRIFS